MDEMVTISKSEYERLRALEEELADIQAALAVETKIAGGQEELIPSIVVDRLLAGEAPLRVWREFRKLTQVALARASGVNRVQIVEIEEGRSTGSVHTLCKLATTLAVDVDDLIQKDLFGHKQSTTVYGEDIALWTKNNLKLPKRSSPINFAIRKRSGLTSNAWGIKVKKTGDAYIYCRDNMKEQKVSLHASGKQHISFHENAPHMAGHKGSRFANQWWEPQHDSEAVATFKLVFPPWGIGLDADQRNSSRSTWNRNHVLIEGHDKFLTVISFIIMDGDKTLRKKEGAPPSYPIGVLSLRPGKMLHVVAGWEPEGNLRTRVDEALKKIPAAQAVPEDLRGSVLSLCLTGYLSANAAYMVVVPVQWQSRGAPLGIVEIAGDRAVRELHRALAFEVEGDHDEAILHYTESLRLNPGHATTYCLRANAHSRKGAWDQAIQDFNKAIELDPDHAEVYNDRGACYEVQGRFDEAILDYGKAIELNPNLVTAYFNRAAACGNKGLLGRAIEDYKRAIELDPNHARAYNNLGAAYEGQGELDRAMENYSKAVEVDPSHGEAQYNIAIIWLRRKDWRKSKLNLASCRQAGIDIATMFQAEYGTVLNFEKRCGVRVPKDIRAMLTLRPITPS